MHACGHDVHMAALVALARAAHALGDALPAALLAVFQPSEEAYPSGAEQLIRGELARLAPAAVVAAHVHPELPWGTVALDPGAVNASCDAVEITVEGEPSHGAYPHHGRDPILAIAQVVVALHAQVARRIDPHGPAVLTVGVLEGGGAENVIPSIARARAALRAHRPADRLALRAMVEEVVSGVAAAHGCRGSVKLVPGEPALENDPAIVARARELLADARASRPPGVALLRLRRLRLLRRAGAARDGVRRARRRRGLSRATAAPSRAAATRRARSEPSHASKRCSISPPLPPSRPTRICPTEVSTFPARESIGKMSIGSACPELAISLRLDPYAPRAARYHVAQVDRPSPDLRDAVVLLTSELVTRAVQRSEQACDADVELRVWMPADVVRVELQASSRLLPAPATDALDYGVLLLDQIADRWSIDGAGDLACMWFEIDRHPSSRQISSVPTSAHTPAPACGEERPGIRCTILWVVEVDSSAATLTSGASKSPIGHHWGGDPR